ncbi:MAG: CRTAC1 family protein [Planctomycetota bacterium]|nr:CRTAC1 family protein [Planctomycetota bacterium]
MSTPTGPSRWRTFATATFLAGLIGFVGYKGQEQPGSSAGSQALQGQDWTFAEVSEASGIRFTHQATTIDPKVQMISAQITATGAGVSVCDFNNDGWMDLYAVSSAEGSMNGLFQNLGDGTFQDVAPAAGLADLNRNGVGCSTGSVWGDFDNDGHQDVLVYKWGQSELFRNQGDGTFANVTAGSGLEGWINSNTANWFDYNRDGILDLFVGGYFAAEHDLWDLNSTRIMQESFEFAHNGGRNHLYRGVGDGTFEDVSEEVGFRDTRWTYATVAADFDRDGWQDLYVANDYGSEELYLNQEGQRFVNAENIGLDGESKSGMSVALGDIWDGERMAVYVTNISKRGYLFQGNNLRVNFLDREGQMVQISEGVSADCGWAWGSQFGDLNNDAWQDLVVVNGFISASQDRDYWYQMSKIGLATGGVITDAALWPDIEDRSLSGYERTRVLLNRGRKGARFREVGLALGIDDRLDGRAVVLADFFQSGRLDMAVANQKGKLLLYRNQAESDSRWIEFRLKGRASGTDAFGTEIQIEHGTRKQMRVHTAASGFAGQNGPIQHFGLGENPGPVKATVRWPSGKTLVLENLELDTVHALEEPQ